MRRVFRGETKETSEKLIDPAKCILEEAKGKKLLLKRLVDGENFEEDSGSTHHRLRYG